jgi:integrase
VVKLFPMPKPESRKRGSYSARVRIPQDIADDYAKAFGPRSSDRKTWPAKAGLSAEEVQELCGEWVRMIEGRFKALRRAKAGQHDILSHREVHALAGEWYRAFVDRYEADPAPIESYDGELGNIILEDELGADVEVPGIDRWLLDRGKALSADSRAALLEVVKPLYAEALTTLAKRARGDYSPDPIRATFPTLERHEDGVSIQELFNQWEAAIKPAKGTVAAWRPVAEAAVKRWPDIRKATEADARAWLQSLVTKDRSARTVNGTWKTAAKTLVNFGITQGVLRSNPFAKIKLPVERRTTNRENKALSDEEAAIILRASLQATNTSLRWLPWVLGYSGTRVGEVAQLRGVDIIERGGIWAMLIRPEAGTVKSRKARTVPLHSHLIEQGFVRWAKEQGDGRIFPAADPANDVVTWVRSLGITDPEVAPNHGWRHRFRLTAERAGIPDRLIDAIGGWSQKSIGRTYGAPALSDLAREIEKLPRYKV